MTLPRFIESMLADGHVIVSAAFGRNGELVAPSPNDLNDAGSILESFERAYRGDLPGVPPVLSRPSLVWGALIVYRASSFLAHRSAEVETMRPAFSDPCPDPNSAAVCYSVDLTFRYLPDLIRIARAVSAEDPLVEMLTELARQWPLSSVGVPNLETIDVAPILGDDCLLRMYVDRIIAANDRSRLSHPRVRDAVYAAIGAHRELAIGLLDELPQT